MIKLNNGRERWVRLLPAVWAFSWSCPFVLECPGCLVIRDFVKISLVVRLYVWFCILEFLYSDLPFSFEDDYSSRSMTTGGLKAPNENGYRCSFCFVQYTYILWYFRICAIPSIQSTRSSTSDSPNKVLGCRSHCDRSGICSESYMRAVFQVGWICLSSNQLPLEGSYSVSNLNYRQYTLYNTHHAIAA